MRRVFFELVAFAKTNQIWRYHTGSPLQKYGDHFAVKVAPGRIAMQAQVGQGRIARTLVQIMHAQSGQRRQVADVVLRPRVSGQLLKCFGWRAQRVFTQGVVVHSGNPSFSLKEFLQQLPALLGPNTP